MCGHRGLTSRRWLPPRHPRVEWKRPLTRNWLTDEQVQNGNVRLQSLVEADRETYFGTYADHLEQAIVVTIEPSVSDVSTVLESLAEAAAGDVR